MPIGAVWEGLGDVRAVLGALAGKADSGVRQAVGDIAHAVEAKAKEKAPVATGTLRRSLHVEGPARAGVVGWEASVGPTVVYGRRVELGYSGTDAAGRTYNTPPQPFLSPAVDEVMPFAYEMFARAVGRAFKGG